MGFKPGFEEWDEKFYSHWLRGQIDRWQDGEYRLSHHLLRSPVLRMSGFSRVLTPSATSVGFCAASSVACTTCKASSRFMRARSPMSVRCPVRLLQGAFCQLVFLVP